MQRGLIEMNAIQQQRDGIGMFQFPNFLTPEECDSIMDLATPRLTQATVLDVQTGQNKIDPVRVAQYAFFTKREFPLITTIEDRICNLVGLPIDNAEGMQLVKYKPGGKYDLHNDYFDPNYEGNKKALGHAGQRVLTALIYLNNVTKGGETDFPQKHVKVIPQKGKIVVWWDTDSSGAVRPDTLHAGCPVVEGEKWIITLWFRENKW